MSADAFLALLVYAFVSSVTPGPNNFMLLASGVNFGFARTIPHMIGISVGFLVLLLAVGLGLGALLAAFPALHLALKLAGGAYLIYLAWRIAMSRSLDNGGENNGAPDDISPGRVLPMGQSESLGHGSDRDGGLRKPGSAFPVGHADRGRVRID